MRFILAMSRGTTHAVGSTRKGRVHAALISGIVLAIGFCGHAAFGATPAPAVAPRSKPVPSVAKHPRRVAVKPTPAATSPGPPIIYSVSASPTVAHAGDAITWDAHVSQNVVSVVARVAVYSFSLYPVRYGHFGEIFSIPKDVPPFFHGNYGVTVTATTANGLTASRSIALSFQ